MKILIGAPIHESKDYAMARWLKNVTQLTRKTPADLFMVDNSPGLSYVEQVRSYCQQYGITNYQIKHLELPPDQEKFERLARCREVIRQAILIGDYDAWFSWENDQIIPVNALDKLVAIAKSGNFSIVSHNNWTRQIPNLPNYDWGVTLISRQALAKYSFILDFGTDPDMPQTYEPSETWFRKQVVRDGGGYLEIEGLINPIYHLDK